MTKAVDFLKFRPPDTVDYQLMDEQMRLISSRIEEKLFESGNVVLYEIPIEHWTADHVRVAKLMSRSGQGKYRPLAGMAKRAAQHEANVKMKKRMRNMSIATGVFVAILIGCIMMWFQRF